MKRLISSYLSNFILLLICLFSLFIIGCPPDPDRLTMCSECEGRQYSLTVTSNFANSGQITITPEGPYKMGDIVIVQFEPNDDYVFSYWYVTPPDLITSSSPSNITAIKIIDNTNMCAFVEEKKKFVKVSWYKNAFNTVNISGGYDELEWSTIDTGYKKMYFDKGSLATLSAELNPNFNPPCDPPYICQHKSIFWSEYFDSAVSTIWNQQNVELIVDTNIELSPIAFYRDNMTFKFLELSSEGENGNEIFFANGQCGTLMPCGYFKYNGYISDPVKFAFGVEPYWTQAFKFWLHGSSKYFVNPVQDEYSNTINFNSYNNCKAYICDRVALGTGQVIEKYNSNGNIEIVDGKGGVVQVDANLYPQSGSFRRKPYQWNPYPYQWDPPYISEGICHNNVVLYAIPCRGLKFSHWKIEEYPNLHLTYNGLEIYMNKWLGDGIHVPPDKYGLSVDAVFTNRALVVEPSGLDPAFVGTSADITLQSLCFGVDVITTNNAYTWLPNLYKYDIFCFAGHGGPGHLALQSMAICDAYCDKCSTCPEVCVSRDCNIQGHVHAFLFVYLLACHCGEQAEEWMQAFNAQCLLAFIGELVPQTAGYFDEVFWRCISEGKDN